ncbi:MAG TPA: hypothetical protein PLW39_11915 [Thermoflexales bacterium]|nr:hypothetical protein [Thermoflexales bacterium]
MAIQTPSGQSYSPPPDAFSVMSEEAQATPAKRKPEEIARERVMILLALVALTPVALKVVELPSRNLSITFLGSALSITFTTASLLIVMLPALVCAGVDWVLRAHPNVQNGGVSFVFPFWIAPGFMALLMALLLTRIPVWPVWVMGLLVGAAILGMLVLAEYSVISLQDSGYAVARLALTAITYLIAFGLLVLVYGTRERSVITATLTFAIIFGLALDLMSPHIIGLRQAAVYAFVVALITAQMTWALNYWNISNWSAAVLLLAVFYLLVGLAQQHYQDRVTGPVLVEFAVVAAIAILAAVMLANVR